MASANFNRLLVIGTVTFERLDHFAIPALLRPHLAALAKAHAALAKEARRAGVARTARAAGSIAIAEADAALGGSVEQLAGALVVAGLAPLRAPFAAFGGKAVSYYTRGSRVRVAKEIGALVVAIRETDPPPLVKQKLAVCARHCGAVTEAYAALGAKRVECRMARGARETAFDAFVAAYSDVKHIARVAWRGDPETFGIVFGEIEADRFGSRGVRKKVAMSDVAVAEERTLSQSSGASPLIASPVVASASGVDASGNEAAHEPRPSLLSVGWMSTRDARAARPNDMRLHVLLGGAARSKAAGTSSLTRAVPAWTPPSTHPSTSSATWCSKSVPSCPPDSR